METSQLKDEVDKSLLTGRARSLANLRPIPKGTVLNPKGRGAPNRRDVFVRLMEEPDEDEPGRTRFEAMVVAMAKNAKLGEGSDGKALLDQYMPKQAPAPTALEYAEHLRNIEADRTRLALAILGERLKTMDGKEVGAFLRECSVGADVFLHMARKLQEVENEDRNVDAVRGGCSGGIESGAIEGGTSLRGMAADDGGEGGSVQDEASETQPAELAQPQEQSSESATVEPNGWNDK